MNYLLDRRPRRKRWRWAIFLLALFLLLYIWTPLFRGLSFGSNALFRPFLVAGKSIGGSFSSFGAYLSSKANLTEENERLREEIAALEAEMANHGTLTAENEELKEVLNRKREEANLVLAAILAKPNQNPYDTLLIDAGNNHGLREGQRVFAYGNVPIGRLAEVNNTTSKVILFSSGGEKTSVVISGSNLSVEALGRGGGNFEILLPRDLAIEAGTEVTLPGTTPRVLGVIEAVISEPRDSFQKVLMLSPVNIFELKFVEVEI